MSGECLSLHMCIESKVVLISIVVVVAGKELCIGSLEAGKEKDIFECFLFA